MFILLVSDCIASLLLAGDIHKNPGPLTFCHLNLGGLLTGNFANKYLLEAFLVVNDFDIVVLGRDAFNLSD